MRFILPRADVCAKGLSQAYLQTAPHKASAVEQALCSLPPHTHTHTHTYTHMCMHTHTCDSCLSYGCRAFNPTFNTELSAAEFNFPRIPYFAVSTVAVHLNLYLGRLTRERRKCLSVWSAVTEASQKTRPLAFSGPIMTLTVTLTV